jgi:ATP-dependent protease ClpP protease subunit
VTIVPNQLQPTPGGTVYVSFSSDVNAHSTESLLAIMANLANIGVAQVHLLLSTPGGNVMHGMNLYNVLRALPFDLTTHNVGNVDSIGNTVFLAGRQRYACENTTFMFHGVGLNAIGQRLEEKSVRQTLASIVADQTRIGAVIQRHTSLTTRQIAGLFREQQTKDAAYAVRFGIVHEIRDVEIPQGTPVIALVFQRQGV